MTHDSAGSRSGRTDSPHRLVSRRRVLAASAGALTGSAALIGALKAQAESTPAGGHNPLAQPDSTVAGPEGLATLLSYVPQRFVQGTGGSGLHWYYADLAQQFDALGVPRDEQGPDGENEDWLPALMTLATASGAFQFARVPEFTDGIGFNPLGVDQTLLAGDPPNQITLFRGGLVPANLVIAWELAGYTLMVTSDGTSIWSIGTDGELDLQHPVQRAVMAAFNNVTLIGDILVCAPTQELLEDALAAGAGGAPSAAADPVFGASLRTLPETTVSAIAVSPAAIGFTTDITLSASATPEEAARLDDLIAQSDENIAPMPPYAGLIAAVEAGAVANEEGDGAGTAMVRIVTASTEDGERATRVVEYRWNEGRSLSTGQPYVELMEITGLSVDDGIAVIDFEQLWSPRVWSDLIMMGDTLPFMIGTPE
ncbi:MAG: hypothetical protein H0V37_05215 [Chloroflexia bacterium]|nr:hypothetical protein [Chloroflexia bacterium]